MKQIIHTLKDREILFKEVRKTSTNIRTYYSGYGNTEIWDDQGIVQIIPGDWQLIGELNSLTEEQAAKLNLTIEALHSLVKSLGIFTENPLGEKPNAANYGIPVIGRIAPIANKWWNDTKQWEAAQSKVWQKILILTNNK